MPGRTGNEGHQGRKILSNNEATLGDILLRKIVFALDGKGLRRRNWKGNYGKEQ